MGVGAVGGVTTTFYNPYVYNTNTVSRASLDKVSAIPDDATKGGAEYIGALKEEQAVNVNPLKPGESKNFADILMSQMSQASLRQAELLATNPANA